MCTPWRGFRVAIKKNLSELSTLPLLNDGRNQSTCFGQTSDVAHETALPFCLFNLRHTFLLTVVAAYLRCDVRQRNDAA